MVKPHWNPWINKNMKCSTQGSPVLGCRPSGQCHWNGCCCIPQKQGGSWRSSHVEEFCFLIPCQASASSMVYLNLHQFNHWWRTEDLQGSGGRGSYSSNLYCYSYLLLGLNCHLAILPLLSDTPFPSPLQYLLSLHHLVGDCSSITNENLSTNDTDLPEAPHSSILFNHT